MKTIYLDNDFEPDHEIERKNSTTGEIERATGLTGLTVHLSLTDGGAAIHADLSKTLTERGTTGLYFALFQGDDLRTHLEGPPLVDRVWMVVGDGLTITYSEQVQVVDGRRP